MMPDHIKNITQNDLKRIKIDNSQRNPTLTKGMLGNLIILIEEFMEFRTDHIELRKDIVEIKEALKKHIEKENKTTSRKKS